MLAALVASLRREVADSQAALVQAVAELARAREQVAELEARLNQTPTVWFTACWSFATAKIGTVKNDAWLHARCGSPSPTARSPLWSLSSPIREQDGTVACPRGPIWRLLCPFCL